MGLAGTQLAERGAAGTLRAHHGMGAHHGGLTVFSVYFTTQSATNSCWRRRALKFGDAQGYGSWRAILPWSLRSLGNMPHRRGCQEFWSSQLHPPSGMEHRFDALTTSVSTVRACQIREVRVLEDSGIFPHHPVQMRLRRSFQGLVARVQATLRALPPPIKGCAREPGCWDIEESTNMDERWARLMHCTVQEIVGSCDIIGAVAQARMGRYDAPPPGSLTTGPDAQGREMVESFERQVASALADGSPAYQTTAPAAAARAD